MADISRISDVQITLGTSGVDQRSFSKMCILAAYDTGPRSQVISDPDQLLEAPFGLTSSSKPYIAATAAFSQSPGPTEVIIGRIDDADTTAEQTLSAVVASNNDWYGLIDGEHNVARAAAYASWVEAHTKLFGIGVLGGTAAQNITTDLGAQLKASNFNRTYTAHIDSADDFHEAALMARKFATLPGGDNWSNTTLNGLQVFALSDNDISNLEFRNINYFTNYRNLALSRVGKVVSGEWIDIIRFRDWLQEEIRVNCVNASIDVKNPYTDDGIAIYGQAIASALDLGVRRGGIVPDYPNEKGNGIVPGYKINLPRSSQISISDKRARVLRDLSFVATLQGAINVTQITGRLVYDTLPSIG